MTLKLKKKTNKGIHYNCPVYACVFISASATNLYDHLKIVHNFYWFGDDKN